MEKHPDADSITIDGVDYILDLGLGAFRKARGKGIRIPVGELADPGFDTLALLSYVAIQKHHPKLSNDEWDEMVDRSGQSVAVIAKVSDALARMAEGSSDSGAEGNGQAGKLQKPTRKPRSRTSE